MKRTLLILLFFTVTISIAQTAAPNWDWGKNINLFSNSKQDMTAVDDQGHVYLISDFIESSISLDGTTFTNTSDEGYSDALLLKFDGDTGDLIWSTQLTGSNHTSITSIDTDDFGNVYLTGSFVGTVTFGGVTLGSSYNRAFIAKLDSSGNHVWAVSNTGSNEYFSLYDVKADQLGNVFVSGYVTSPSLTFGEVEMTIGTNTEIAYNLKPFVTKFDENGVCLWGKLGVCDTENAMGSLAMSVAPDQSGGVAITGRYAHNDLTFDNVTVTKSTQDNFNSNMFLFKFDSSGVADWGFSAGSPYLNNSMGHSTVVDSEGNVYFSGIFTNTAQFGDITLSANFGSQMFISKFQPSGVVSWAKTINYSDGYTGGRSVDVDENDNVYVGGLTYASNIYFNEDVSVTNLGDEGAFFVTKYNSSGTALWAKGVSNIDANNDISIDCRAEDDIMVGGSFDKTSLQLGSIVLNRNASNTDAFVARLYTENLSISEFEDIQVSIFPNPASENIFVTHLSSHHTFELYDMLGKHVKNGTVSPDNSMIDLSDMTSGIYILTLTDGQGKVSQQKVVIE